MIIIRRIPGSKYFIEILFVEQEPMDGEVTATTATFGWGTDSDIGRRCGAGGGRRDRLSGPRSGQRQCHCGNQIARTPL